MKAKPYPLRPATLLHRLAAYILDAITITFVLSVSTSLFLIVVECLVLLGAINPAADQSLSQLISTSASLRMILILYIAIIWITFFVVSWVKKGQTIGMKICHLVVKTPEQTGITYTQALIRLFSSCFGLSNLISPFDPQKRAFHDIWANTQVFILPKKD